MADGKKPRIDLKARLAKTAVGATPPPTAAAAVPGKSVPPAAGAGVPVPPGISVPPPPFAGGLDPSNPLAAAAGLAPQAKAQRIEVDESAVLHARKEARNQGLIVAAIAALLFAGVGYAAGGAGEQSAGRNKSKNDAKELSQDVSKAKESLTALVGKLETGRNQLLKERKFPDTLAKDLGGINVDFDGTKLAGRRFSGFPQEVTGNLVEFITAVQALNDRKQIVQGLLSKLQKPLTEQLSAPAGQQTLAHVVIVDRDPAGNPSALLASLAQPITFTPPKLDLPAEFTFTNPLGQGNASLPRYNGGDIANKPAALYVVPKTFDKVCPSETAGQSAQLAAQMGGILRDIRGEQQSQEYVQDTKPGLLERADKLVTGLNKI